MLSLIRNTHHHPHLHINIVKRTMLTIQTQTQTQTHKQPCKCCSICNPLTKVEQEEEAKSSAIILMGAMFCYAVARGTRDTPDYGINQSDPTGLREIRKNWNNKT
jgi:hypothetical protein